MPSKDYLSLKHRHCSFSWTQPVGYDFNEVEKAIEEYKAAVENAMEVLDAKEKQVKMLKSEVERLQSEVTNAQIQMTAITTPACDPKKDFQTLTEHSGGQFMSAILEEEASRENQGLPSDPKQKKFKIIT